MSNKSDRTPGQLAKGARQWACDRKPRYATKEEARKAAAGLVVYECSYGKHFHCAAVPGRFVRRRAA
jgi:hypothetical protein